MREHGASDRAGSGIEGERLSDRECVLKVEPKELC